MSTRDQLAAWLEPTHSSPILQALHSSWRQKRADELAAILVLLARYPEPSVSELGQKALEAYLSFPEETREWLVTLPSMPYWQRLAAVLASQNPAASKLLAESPFVLHDVYRFMFAAAIRCRQTFGIALSVPAGSEVWLPGTGLQLKSDQSLELTWDGLQLGIVAGNERMSLPIEFQADGEAFWPSPIATGKGWSLWRTPLLWGSLEVELHDAYLTQAFKDCTFLSPAREDGGAYFNLLEYASRTLEVVWPEVIQEMQLIDRQIVWVSNPNRPDEVYSFSDNSVAGALYFSITTSSGLLPMEDVLDSFVHEHLHQKLYLLEAEHSLYDPLKGQTFRSPWRVDPRPIGGVFHGYFVFHGLLELWTRAAKIGPLRPYAKSRITQIEQQLIDARQVLEENAHFSKVGQELFEHMGAVAR